MNVWVFCCYNGSEGIKRHFVSKVEFFSLFLSLFSFYVGAKCGGGSGGVGVQVSTLWEIWGCWEGP